MFSFPHSCQEMYGTAPTAHRDPHASWSALLCAALGAMKLCVRACTHTCLVACVHACEGAPAVPTIRYHRGSRLRHAYVFSVLSVRECSAIHAVLFSRACVEVVRWHTRPIARHDQWGQASSPLMQGTPASSRYRDYEGTSSRLSIRNIVDERAGRPGKADERTGEWVKARTGGRKGGWVDGWVDGWKDGQTDQRLDGRTGGRAGGQAGGRARVKNSCRSSVQQLTSS